MSRRAPARGRGLPAGRQALREPGVTSLVPRVVLLELKRRGIPADELLARNGLTDDQVMDPDAWVTQRSLAGFFRDAVEASGDPAFAWMVGRNTPLEGARMISQSTMLSSTVRQALDTFVRYYELFMEGTRVSVRSTAQHDAISWTRLPAYPPLHDNCLSFAAVMLQAIERISGPVRPVEIRVTGPAPSPMAAAAVAKASGAPVRWGADHFELRLPPGTFDRPTFTSDPEFRSRMVELADRELAMHRGSSMVARVRGAILREGFDRTASVASVANLLGTTSRSLQRWLAEESRTFSQVRGEVLGEAARELLAEKGLPIPEVAARLGFSSRATFHRAIRRWTGKTPSELRGARKVRRRG